MIVDNISTLCRSVKENDADSWAPVQEWILRMRAEKRTVLFIHHTGKSGNQRGTSKREDILDTVISLKPTHAFDGTNGAAFEMHFKKTRGFYGEEAEPFSVQLQTCEDGSIEWMMADVKESTYEQVLSLLADGCTQQDIANKLKIHKSSVCRYV